jgi:hypothetical protein
VVFVAITRMLALMAVVLACAQPAQAAPHCGSFPLAVREASSTGAAADCPLREVGAPPLWSGVPEGADAVTRFSFMDGRGRFFRAVTITETPGGAELVLEGFGADFTPRRASLPAEALEDLHRLAAIAKIWSMEISTWDSPEVVFVHCQTLDIERVDATGYRYSAVMISCNRPGLLMPLVHEVARLAKLRNVDGVFQ